MIFSLCCQLSARVYPLSHYIGIRRPGDPSDMTDGKLAALHSLSLEAIGKAKVLCRDLCRDIHTLLEEMQSKLNEMYSPAPALPPPPKPASPDPTSSTPVTPAVPLASSHTAAVRLQAAARGLLACRKVQSLRREKRLAIVSRSIIGGAGSGAPTGSRARGSLSGGGCERCACCSARRCSARSTTRACLHALRLQLK